VNSVTPLLASQEGTPKVSPGGDARQRVGARGARGHGGTGGTGARGARGARGHGGHGGHGGMGARGRGAAHAAEVGAREGGAASGGGVLRLRLGSDTLVARPEHSRLFANVAVGEAPRSAAGPGGLLRAPVFGTVQARAISQWVRSHDYVVGYDRLYLFDGGGVLGVGTGGTEGGAGVREGCCD